MTTVTTDTGTVSVGPLPDGRFRITVDDGFRVHEDLTPAQAQKIGAALAGTLDAVAREEWARIVHTTAAYRGGESTPDQPHLTGRALTARELLREIANEANGRAAQMLRDLCLALDV